MRWGVVVVVLLLAIFALAARQKKGENYLVLPYYPGDSEYRGNPYALSESNAS